MCIVHTIFSAIELMSYIYALKQNGYSLSKTLCDCFMDGTARAWRCPNFYQIVISNRFFRSYYESVSLFYCTKIMNFFVDLVLSVGAIEHVKCSKCRYLNWSIVLRNIYSEPDFLNQLTSTTRNCTNLLWNFSTHHNVRVLWSMIWLRQPTGTLTGSDGLIPSKLHCSNLMGVDMVVVVAAPMGQPQSMSRSTQWNR